MPFYSLLVFFLLCALIHCFASEVPSLAESSVLLPRKTAQSQVQYQLDAFNGCFQWTSLDTAVASVHPIYNSEPSGASGCTTRIFIFPESTSTERQSTWIEAKEVRSSFVLRCEVFVDTIKNFSILTTTKKFYQSDVELLKVQAFDEEGNLFSSVEGLPFEWAISPSKPLSGAVLRLLPFKDSNVEASPLVLLMEEKGQQTGAVLLQGVQPGKADVLAKLADIEQVGEVLSARVQVSVVEPLIVTPVDGVPFSSAPIYVAPGSKVQYLLSVHSSVPAAPIQSISMPNPKYSWTSENQRIATVTDAGLVTAHSPGTVHIYVRHADVPDSEAHATLHVVIPAELRIAITPHSSSSVETARAAEASSTKWVVVGHQYDTKLVLYDASGHAISHTDALRFDVTVDKSHLKLLESHQNNAQHLMTPVAVTSSRISASLNSREWKVPSADLLVQSSTEVITAPQKEVILPWDPSQGTPSVVYVKPAGGSGHYHWHSANSSIATVSSTNLVTANSPGTTTVTVSDSRNAQNSATLTVAIVPVARIQLLPPTRDCQVGHVVSVKVEAWTVDGQMFSNCSALPFEWQIHPPSVFSLQVGGDIVQNTRGGCTAVSLLAVGEGEATVTLRYGKMVDQIKLFTYAPLQVHSPSPLIVAVGSAAPILFEGGPYEHEGSRLFFSVFSKDHDKLKIEKSDHSLKSSWFVTCLQLGDGEVGIAFGDNPQVPSIKEEIQVSCVIPAKLKLLPVLPEDSPRLQGRDAQACKDLGIRPVELMTSPPSPTYLTSNNRDITFSLLLKDDKNREIGYYSSLAVEWSSHEPGARFTANHEKRGQAVLHIGNVRGSIPIKVSVPGYREDALPDLPALPTHQLSARFTLSVMPRVSLTPEEVLIYNHPNNVVRLAKQDGTLVSYSTNDSSVVELSPATDSSTLNIKPLRPGTAMVTARDRCLPDAQSGESTVHVGDVAWIKVELPPTHEKLGGQSQSVVQVGEELLLTVVVGAGPRDGERPYPSAQYRHIPLDFHVDHPASVRVTPVPDHPEQFLLRALSAGLSHVIFSVKTLYSGSLLSSSSLSVTVYAPITIRPRALVLVPGGRFRVEAVGGPPIQPQFSYSVDNITVCSVDAEGQLLALSPGHATLTAIVSSPATSIVSTASIPVDVNSFDGIMIHANTDRLVVGNEMTLRVGGPDGETPFTLGTLNIRFTWHSRDPTVASIIPIYAEAGARLEDEMGFSVRVKALAPGSATISVAASNSHAWTAGQVITVVDGLILLTPAEVLLPPQGRHAIVTNKHGCAGCLTFKVLDASPEDVVSVSAQGVVTARPTTGQAVVQVVDNRGLSQIVQIRIRPIHQIQLLPTVASFQQIPIGGEMEVRVAVRDEVGQIFTSIDGLQLDYQLDQPEIVSVGLLGWNQDTETERPPQQGPSLLLTAVKEGETILRVFTVGSLLLDDYLKVSVGQAIRPPMPVVHVGGTISFSTTLPPHPDVIHRHLWSSDNEAVLRINSTTGEAQAFAVGHALARYNGTVSTYTKVEVARVGKIKVNVEAGFVSNVGERKEYHFKLDYADTMGRDMPPKQGRIDNKIVTSCSLPPSTLWITTKFYSNPNGEDFCVLSTTPPTASETLPAQMPDSITLIVNVRDGYGTYEMQHLETIPFVPAFLVKGNQQMVELSPSRPWAYVEVWSSSPIFATTTDAARLSVKLYSSDRISGRHVYEIRASPSASPFTDAGVELLNPLSQQSVTLLVSFGYDVQLITTDKRQQTGAISVVGERPTATTWLQPIGWVVGSAILAALVLMIILRSMNRSPQSTSSFATSPSPLRASPSARPLFSHSVSSPLQPPTARRQTLHPRSPVYYSPYQDK